MTRRPGNLVLAIAGATSGATAMLFDLVTKKPIATRVARGILPLEESEDSLYYSVRELCNEIAERMNYTAREASQLSHATVAFSSSRSTSSYERIAAATSDSRLGPTSPRRITWITRGEACLFSSLETTDCIVVKVGTVAFAHAFASGLRNWHTSSRAGGWGLLSGNDGGAYFLGRQLLYRLFEEFDGRAPLALSSPIIEEIGATAETLTAWIRRRRIENSLRVEVSKLGRLVVELAEAGRNMVCRDLVQQAAILLAHSCVASIENLRLRCSGFGRECITVLLQGRLLQGSSLLASLFTESVRNSLIPGLSDAVIFRPLLLTPAAGCLAHSLSEGQGYSWSRIEELLASCADSPGFRVDFNPDVIEILRRRSLQ